METQNKKLNLKEFRSLQKDVLKTWKTGKDVDLKDGIRYQQQLPHQKNFARTLKIADKEQQVLLQPRAGVALVDEHIKLIKHLEEASDLLPTTIDAYTRQNLYQEAQKGIEKSLAAGHSLLNGFPAVNHGVKKCRQVIENLNKPVEIRHGTPDARLLAEITLAAGFSSFEGGGISYNIPYAKKIPLEKSIYDWQYVDYLIGIYEDNGVRINREPFGPLSGTLIPPFISHVIGIIEGLLALEQGVKSVTLGYGQAGNYIQDTAAMVSLKKLAHHYFKKAGHSGYELTTVFHQWMGGFPENEARAFAVINWGATVAALSKATKVIVKTPHEAMGIPTPEANLQGLLATRQTVNMLEDQTVLKSKELQEETELICEEVKIVLDKVFELGQGDVASGTVKAFSAGVLDVPFAPSAFNPGKLLPVRDNHGAIRIMDKGKVPVNDSIFKYHREKIEARAKNEGRKPSFQMVIDDIYAITKGKLVGRPK